MTWSSEPRRLADPAAEELLRELVDRGFRVSPAGGKVRLQTAGMPVAPDTADRIRRHREGLLGILGGRKFAPLSPAQERLWILDQLGDRDAYKLPAVGRLEGRCDLSALARAFGVFAARHEAPRATFPTLAGRPVQAIAGPDWRPGFAVAEVDGEDAADRLVAERIGEPFDLATGPLWGVDAIRTGTDRVRLLVRQHHIISDAWSLRVMLAEVSAAYSAYTAGREPELPPVSLQCTGYAAAARLSGVEPTAAVEYWRRTLSDASDLELPPDPAGTDKPVGARGSVVLTHVDAGTNRQVYSLARKAGVTGLSVWLAALYVVLRKRGGGDDFCVGVPTADRGDPATNRLVGFLVDTLIVRLRPPSPDPASLGGPLPGVSATELIVAVHRAVAEALDHRDVPVERILAELRRPRRPDRSPVFQVLFGYAPEPVAPVALGPGTLTPLLPPAQAAKFDLTVSVTEQADGGALVTVEHSTDRFAESTARAMAAELVRVAGHLAAGELPGAISLADQNALARLREWGAPTPPSSTRLASAGAERDLPEGIAALAAEDPGALALVEGTRRVTRAELQAWAQGIADRLIADGAGPGCVVAVCLARSARLIAAMLGILRTGAAFLPLDPGDPPARFTDALTDAGAGWLLSDGSLPGSLRTAVASMGLRTVNLGHLPPTAPRPAPGIGDAPGAGRPPGWRSQGDPPAYLLFTSGSTGRPKAAVIGRQALSAHSAAVLATFGPVATDRVAQFSSPAFDIFIEEVFPTLRVGGVLVILSDQARRDPRELAAEARAAAVTMLNLPTAFFHVLAADPVAVRELPRCLRSVIVGGERLAAEAARGFLRRRPEVRLVNTYGPTECTVTATAYVVEPDFAGEDIPIGRPLPGVEAWVLDPDGRPCPVEATGELHLGGLGLMQEYRGRPELTARAFAPHPVHPERRVYRTGDRAAWRADGVLRFAGRVDRQVKLRGFRVELDEVEAVLSADPVVAEAVVVVGNGRLGALMTARPGQEIDRERLLRRVGERLAPQMVPSAVFVVAGIPRTPGGKPDRHWATAEIERRWNRGTTPAEFSDPLEARVRQIWASCLERPDLGRDEDFFRAGGHSLLAIQLVRRLQSEIGGPATVAELFRFPTVRTLTARLRSTVPDRGADGEPARLASPLLMGEGRRGVCRPVLLRDARQVSVILPGLPGVGDQYHELAGCLPTQAPVYSFSLPGHDGGPTAESIGEIAGLWGSALQRDHPEARIDFFAHSYSCAVLHELLCRAGTLRLRVGRVVLIDGFPHQLSDGLPAGQLESWLQAAGVATIPEARRVVAAALSARHELPARPAPFPATLVIAESSRSWLDGSVWRGWFPDLQVLVTPGDHLSVVRPPDCLNWLGRLP